MLVWGYLFWMMASLGLIQNDGSGLLLALIVLAAISAVRHAPEGNASILCGEWIKSNLRLIATVEVLFFLAFGILAFVRAGNPEIVGTEKPMELAFINAVMHSPTFPPHDPWLSGYAISYYYFGYVMTAMLAKATGTLGSVAFNLMLSLVFAIKRSGSLRNSLQFAGLQAQSQTEDTAVEQPSEKPDIIHSACPYLAHSFSCWSVILKVFWKSSMSGGIFWKFNARWRSHTSAFWRWLIIQDLRDAPWQS